MATAIPNDAAARRWHRSSTPKPRNNVVESSAERHLRRIALRSVVRSDEEEVRNIRRGGDEDQCAEQPGAVTHTFRVPSQLIGKPQQLHSSVARQLEQFRKLRRNERGRLEILASAGDDGQFVRC
jgi:hypothetical protein